MAAALVDQNALVSKRIKYSDILASVQNKEQRFIGPRVRELALVIRELMDLADPELPPFLTISQISGYIGKVFHRNKIPCWPWVSEYFHGEHEGRSDWEQFLDPIQQNNALSNRSVTPSQYGGIDAKLLIEEFLSLPDSEIDKLPVATQILLHEKAKKVKGKLENNARDGHFKLNDTEIREHIGTRKMPPRETDFGKAMIYLGKTYIDFGIWVNQNFAAPADLEAKENWAAGPMTIASMYNNLMNEKYSLDDVDWIERDVYRVHQSKHGAAVKDKVDSTLCKHCSKLDREYYEPSDFVEMEFDLSSPTQWRCRECNGTAHVKRPLTREQCGDKAAQSCPSCGYHLSWEQGLSPIENRAIELAHGIEAWNNSQHYYKTLAQKLVACRRVKLGVDLSSKA